MFVCQRALVQISKLSPVVSGSLLKVGNLPSKEMSMWTQCDVDEGRVHNKYNGTGTMILQQTIMARRVHRFLFFLSFLSFFFSFFLSFFLYLFLFLSFWAELGCKPGRPCGVRYVSSSLSSCDYGEPNPGRNPPPPSWTPSFVLFLGRARRSRDGHMESCLDCRAGPPRETPSWPLGGGGFWHHIVTWSGDSDHVTGR